MTTKTIRMSCEEERKGGKPERRQAVGPALCVPDTDNAGDAWGFT